jgi:hypothetical protein
VCGGRKGPDVFFFRQKTPKCALGGGAQYGFMPIMVLKMEACRMLKVILVPTITRRLAGFHLLSGEEVSVSLGFALRTTDRLTPPIRASKTEAPLKSWWNPKKINLGMKPKKDSQAEKGDGPNKDRTIPKTPGNKCHIMPDGTKPCRPRSN